ncbi:MAG: glycosyltransferase family 39 protein [Candidatus Rokubacteria bacterium]|nr:glycosyltransferase family 39 protein [Candidatus Rokubacteria bacterium]
MPHGNRLRSVLALAVLAAVIAAARLLTYDEPLERDITGAAVMGRELLEGRALYSDVWDHKPPAMHVTHALSQRVAGYGRGAIYLLGTTAAIVTLLGVHAAGVAAGGPTAGLWAAAFWTVVSGDLWLQGNQPNTEAFINACLVWAFVLLVRVERGAPGVGRFVAVGALFALASLYKSVNVASAAALALAWLAWPPPDAGGRRRALVSVAAMAAVGLVVWVLVVGYFAATGRLGAFNEAVFAYNRFYAGSITANLLKLFTPAVHRAMISTIPIVTFVAVGAVLGLFRGDRRRWVFLLAWAAGTAVAVAAPGKFYPHYSQLWLPLLAVGGGWAAGVLARLAPPRLASLPHLAGFIVIALLVVYQLPLYQLSPDDFSKAKYRTDLFVEERSLARELVTLLTPEESFYEFGAEMGLYFESRRRPVTGAFYAYPLLSGPVAAKLSERVVKDLARRPPDLFVVADWAAGARNPVLDWAKAHYRLAPGDPMRGPFLLYVRPGSALERRMDAAPTRPGR